MGTTNYANQAKTKRIGARDGFNHRENTLIASTLFLSLAVRSAVEVDYSRQRIDRFARCAESARRLLFECAIFARLVAAS